MNTLVLNIEDDCLKLSLDDQELNQERLNQDLPNKNERSLKSLRIQNKRQLPISYKTTSNYESDYHEEEDSLTRRSPESDHFEYFMKIFVAACFLLLFIMLIAMITLAIEERLKEKFVNYNNSNNSSVSIFTPNGLLQVESYTLNNNVFVGFIKKANA